MPESAFSIDAIVLESRLSTIETKLSDTSARERLAAVEAETKALTASSVRMDERFRSLPNEKELTDLLQRLARLETRVAHLPSKGFIITVVTTIGALIGTVLSFGKLRIILGL
ncbi:hypothetical protein [uncultured Enterovirga sp.]|uniref:hypothetical protein n=1 Tax=uncultured Enterovirga sp. TaxID=2026352 RepID=UPI0035CC033B